MNGSAHSFLMRGIQIKLLSVLGKSMTALTVGYQLAWSSLMAQEVKNLCNAGDTGDASSIPGSGSSPGGGDGNSLQYLCLGNARDRGA